VHIVQVETTTSTESSGSERDAPSRPIRVTGGAKASIRKFLGGPGGLGVAEP